jgi:hypothetical protein
LLFGQGDLGKDRLLVAAEAPSSCLVARAACLPRAKTLAWCVCGVSRHDHDRCQRERRNDGESADSVPFSEANRIFFSPSNCFPRARNQPAAPRILELLDPARSLLVTLATRDRQGPTTGSSCSNKDCDDCHDNRQQTTTPACRAVSSLRALPWLLDLAHRLGSCGSCAAAGSAPASDGQF